MSLAMRALCYVITPDILHDLSRAHASKAGLELLVSLQSEYQGKVLFL